MFMYILYTEIHHGNLVYKVVIVLITDVARCLWQLFWEKINDHHLNNLIKSLPVERHDDVICN